MSAGKRVKFNRGEHEWSYRGEQWVTNLCGVMSISRWQDQEEPFLFRVSRHINGHALGIQTGLNFVESEALVEAWLNTSSDDPDIKDYVQAYEARKMAKLL